MIYVGIDDTDLLDTPGTNHLARHLVQRLAGEWRGHLITRHQLLQDPRVPCTRKNGCVAIAFEPLLATSIAQLEEAISRIMLSWCPLGSDPGICITENQVPQQVIDFGHTCQQELVDQRQARELAQAHGILLRGLGGTEDGVIGALAAVGLMASRDDGRVILIGSSEIDHFNISGVHAIGAMRQFGIDEVRRIDNGQPVVQGSVDLGKRLRPNYRKGKFVLFVSPNPQERIDWIAERVL